MVTSSSEEPAAKRARTYGANTDGNAACTCSGPGTSSGISTADRQLSLSHGSTVDKCRQLDEGLTATFRRGDIRLLRRAWVLEAPDQHLPYRQVLEERERRGEMPLLSPEEAAALLERGDRSIGALTQCAPPVPSGPSRTPPPDCTDQAELRSHRSPWYSPGDPDPAGVKLKILREALLVLTHIEAIFVDYASLFQASGPARSHRTPSVAS